MAVFAFLVFLDIKQILYGILGSKYQLFDIYIYEHAFFGHKTQETIIYRLVMSNHYLMLLFKKNRNFGRKISSLNPRPPP